MKKIFVISFATILIIACKAQQEFPLNTFPQEIPAGSYIKDFNHQLDPYVGTFKATSNGNEVTLVISKETKKFFDFGNNLNFYKDALLIRYSIINSTGQILQNTIGSSDFKKNTIFDMGFKNTLNSFKFYYTGTNCGVGYGNIFLHKIDNTKFNWSYYPNDITLTAASCSGNPDLNIYLPTTENLIFTKQ